MSNSYQRENFSNELEVRWCPGCGDYAILAALQRILPELNLPPEKHVFVSGIGCAGRLPYYMNAYGYHTIHGRAPAVATGLKAMREDLTVWIITGDGDALSIGANHLLHCLRRNLNVKILLFNNQVYGLTKGQFSPTSPLGQVTKTSPEGVSQQPVNPVLFALAAGASFVARAVDKDPNHLASLIKAAHAHQGAAFIEIYQDCNIFNHGAFDAFALKANRAENTLILEEGAPLIFGQEGQHSLELQADNLVVADRNTASSGYVHRQGSLIQAFRLSQLTYPAFPVPLGIYYCQERPVYSLDKPIKKTMVDLKDLYRQNASWIQS